MYKLKDLKDLVIVLNSTRGCKYPLGNKDLCLRVHYLEEEGILNYDELNQTWEIA